MDAKDLRIEPALSEHSSDGTKYTQSGTTLQCNRNKSYQDIGSNPSTKVDAPSVRPCAVIGPDRIVPPSESNDAYIKKAQVEPWPCPEPVYHRPPEYPHKAAAYHNPTRNISPRQTFQENMQRIMVPPTYNSVKASEDAGFIQKLGGTSDAKYCDVPYSVNPNANEPKNIRSVEMCLPNVNSALGRPPHGWAPGGINIRPQRPYVSPDIYQYPDYPSCAGPRPVSISRPHRTIPEDSAYMFPEHYYQEPNIRFKPYPNMKERCPQPRYDYVTNYSNPFHPPPCPPQKYDVTKSLPPHPYSGYSHFKYVDSRMPEAILEGYQRPVAQQGNYNMAYRNQIVHPAYGPMMSNNSQPKVPPYPPDGPFKAVASNKLPYDSNGKIYLEYDNGRTKPILPSDNFYPNETSRHHAIPKGVVPNYPSLNIHSLPHTYYRKDNSHIKNYEYMNHCKNLNAAINMNGSIQRLMPQFSPNAIAISPTDSSTSNDTSQTHSTSQEDCGYASQSSTTSIRSIDLGNSRIPNEYYGRYYDPRYGPVIRTAPPLSKTNRNSNSSTMENKEKKDMDVRKFLQMWNEGDDDNAENVSNKEPPNQNNPKEPSNTTKLHGVMNNQEQLYVLGLVHVPNEELSKYEHIQKVSKLPENIKGYNSIELLNQFEEVIESSNMNGFKLPTTKEFQTPLKQCAPKPSIAMLPRPISPLDVEAKISQSVIHKEVGCNFEIKPCSPKMLNVEIASPIQNILNERVIEKISNPLSMITSPILNGIDNIELCKIPDVTQDQRILDDSDKVSSCKMINTQFSDPDKHSIKTNYSIQDLESNAGVCLASLPRLDNDIELNFPEVNQQFINANKGESTMATQIKDLPELCELDQTGKLVNNIKPESFDTSSLSPKFEPEREFTKLSKYRKNKINISDSRQDKSALNAVRTDSVIIKNPENAKALDIEQVQNAINNIKQINQQTCSNLNPQEDFVDDNVSARDILNETETNDIARNSLDVAIDFRLHKDADKNFELKHSSDIKKSCDLINFPKEEEFLSKNNLYENKEEPPKYTEINKVEMFTKEIDGDISSNAKDTEGNIEANIVSSTLNIATLVSSSEIEELDAPDNINKLDVYPYLSQNTEVITKSTNTSESKTLELELPDKDLDRNISQIINNGDTLTEKLVERNISSPKNSEIKNEINTVVACDISNGQCKVIKPIQDINILNNDKTRESEPSSVKSDFIKDINKPILQNETVVLLPTRKKDEVQYNSSDFQISMDNDEKISDQLDHKENWILHTECIEFSEPLRNTEITDMSNLDESFIGIDEKLIRGKETDSNYVVGSELNCKNEENNESKQYVSKFSGYGSKELYSPWIQNLIMFDEGVCCTLYCEKNKISSINVDIQPILELSTDNSIATSNADDCSSEICERIGCENSFSKTNSDDILKSGNYVQVETNRLPSPTQRNQLEVKENCEVVGIQDIFMETNQSEILLDDLKGPEVKIKNCEEDENIDNNTTTETDICGQNGKFGDEIENNEVDDKKQRSNIITTKDVDVYTVDKNENKHKIEPNITKNRLSLKRSLSDSALNILHCESQSNRDEFSVIWPFKRSKLVNSENESEIIAQNLCNILQHNRRNSISASYNEDVSFCILIEDNAIITEANDDEQKLCYAELSDECLNEINSTYTCEENNEGITGESVTCNEEANSEYSNTITFNGDHDIALDGTWVEDVACVETVVSDDIAEDIVVNSVSTPKGINFWGDDESYNDVTSDKEDNTAAVSPKYDDELIHSDPEIFKLCDTPQIEMDKTLTPKNFQSSEVFGLYDTESLEKILSESNSRNGSPYNNSKRVTPSQSPEPIMTPDCKENMNITLSEANVNGKGFGTADEIDSKINQEHNAIKMDNMDDVAVHSPESSCDNVFSYNNENNNIHYTTSSSPEVSSTTSEEKSSSLLLKITNYKGTKISQIKTVNLNNNNNKISCKFTEKTDYINLNTKSDNTNRPLITKAAQKYIPPIKESIRDLKVKLPLPQHSLLKLKQMKTSKDEPKLSKQINVPSRLPKKPKPKFEDVLKSIDEIQIKMHKEKTKKVKKSIPKVVIKKNENGSHYASTSNKDTFNPDLTGRKWQPWVFLEKNYFIDKMATRKKTKAIFSHRKNAYVLAEKFHKYKSASSTKFVISQPKLSDSATGHLKYTIRLKHSY